jgi:chromosome segregation ATPase
MSTTTSRVGRRASLAVCIGALGITWLQSHRIGAKLSAVRDHVENRHSTNLRDDIDEIRAMVAAVHDQVEDHHSTNLRDEIDEIRAMVAAVRADICDRRHDIDSLGGELRDERDVRVSLEQHAAQLRSAEDVPSFVEVR